MQSLPNLLPWHKLLFTGAAAALLGFAAGYTTAPEGSASFSPQANRSGTERTGTPAATISSGFSSTGARTITVVSGNQDIGALIDEALSAGSSPEALRKAWALIATLQPHEFALMADRISQSRGYSVRPVLSELYRVWAQHDPQAAITSAQTQKDSAYISAVVSGWAEKDRAAVQAWINQLPEGSIKRTARIALLSALAQTSPSEALAMISADPSLAKREYWNAIFSQMAARDPRGAIEAAMQLPAGQSRNDAILSLAQSWSRVDPEAAASWLTQLPPSATRNQALRNLIPQFAQTNPEAALNLAMSNLLPANDRNYIISQAMSVWAGRDQAAALSWAQQLPEGIYRRSALVSIASRMAQDNPQAAIDFAMKEGNSQTRTQMLSGVLQQWLSSDPYSGIAWLQSNHDKVQPATLQNLVHNLVNTNPQQALGMIQWLPEGPMQRSSYNLVASTWARNDPSAAESWLRSMPEGPEKDQFLQGFVNGIASVDAAHAGSLVEQLPEGRTRDALLQSVATQWARTDPNAAIDWLASAPPGPARDKALANAIQQWTYADAYAATSWVSGLPPGRTRDTVIQQIAPIMITTEPESAIEWAASISNNKQKTEALTNLARTWLRNDPQTATAYLKNSPNVPAAVKQALFERKR